ncbi:MAG: hypothetical protein ABSD96_01865 [Candidatus Korobacteraceae bacterium]|jgi:hypothetical protein
MQQIFLVDPETEHFTDEQSFRLKLPNLAQLVDSQLPRRSLTPENCAFEYAHKGRLKNSLGQVCTFQASFSLKDNPESHAKVELIALANVDGTERGARTVFRYERDTEE